VLEDDAIFIILGDLDDIETFQVDDFIGNFGFHVAKDEDSGIDEL
jgi:hypothetical protein